MALKELAPMGGADAFGASALSANNASQDRRAIEAARRAEEEAARKKKRAREQGTPEMVGAMGYKSGGSVKAKGMGKARTGKPCKVC